MNKELIKKYKKEFDYWVNDGTLLVADSYEKRWITLTKNVWLCETTKNLLIIIDDEYVEFRKALAEGKTVQCNRSYGEFYGCLPVWEDISIHILENFSIEHLRIKQEKFFYKVDILCQNGIESQVIYRHSEQLIGKYNYVIVEYNGYNRIGRINTLISEPKFSCKDISSCINLKELKLV